MTSDRRASKPPADSCAMHGFLGDEDAAQAVRRTEELLDAVLRQTESQTQSGSNGDDQDLLVLRSVAKRRAGMPFSLDPVLIDLVYAILVGQGSEVGSPDVWRSIARRVATTMFENPDVYIRLNLLWSRLSQANQ